MRARVLEGGQWHGCRSYDSSRDTGLPMDLTLERAGSTLGGSGTDQDGAFTLTGTISDDNEVALEARYESPGKLIELAGSFDRRTGKVSGRWRVEGRRHGTFELERGKRPTRSRKPRPLPPPIALPTDPDRVEALLARVLAQRELPSLPPMYLEAWQALKAFAKRHAFGTPTGITAPMNTLCQATDQLAATVSGPLTPATHARARDEARAIVVRAEQLMQTIAQAPVVRLNLDEASRHELAQLFATWLEQLRIEANRRRNTVYITAALGQILSEMEAALAASP